MSWPAYPEYKESVTEWLDEIPVYWDERRGKYLFERMQRAARSGDEIVTAFRDGEVTLRRERREEGFTVALKESGYQGVRRGDLVIHAMDAFAGAIGVSAADGKCSPVYSCCRPQSGVSARLYAYLLRAMAGIGFIESLAKGIRERSTDFRWADFGELRLPVPPSDEQETITQFLDHETARIDALIEEQQRLIELLQEKRLAVISHAVTKGLDPDVPMKDSGVEWMGEIPAHWSVMKFLRCIRIAEGQVDPTDPSVKDMTLVAPNHVESGTGVVLAKESAVTQGAESGKYLCREGDVIYSKIRPSLRKACLADESCLCSADMYPLRTVYALQPNYLLWLVLSESFSNLAVLESERVAMPKINRESLNEIRLPVPPLAEQERIYEWIVSKVESIDVLSGQAHENVALLRERRSALISAAVTGKIDVRGWKPQNAPVESELPHAAETEAPYG